MRDETYLLNERVTQINKSPLGNESNWDPRLSFLGILALYALDTLGSTLDRDAGAAAAT